MNTSSAHAVRTWTSSSYTVVAMRRQLVYYITDYVTKTNLSFHDTFSLVLKAVKSMEKSPLGSADSMSAEEKSRRLVLRCYNTLAYQQELSGMQVASYLMGWPDHYTTHEFANIHLISVEHYLQAALLDERSKGQQQQPTGNINHSLHYAEMTLHFSEPPAASEDEDEIRMDAEEQFLLQPSVNRQPNMSLSTVESTINIVHRPLRPRSILANRIPSDSALSDMIRLSEDRRIRQSESDVNLKFPTLSDCRIVLDSGYRILQ